MIGVRQPAEAVPPRAPAPAPAPAAVADPYGSLVASYGAPGGGGLVAGGAQTFETESTPVHKNRGTTLWAKTTLSSLKNTALVLQTLNSDLDLSHGRVCVCLCAATGGDDTGSEPGAGGGALERDGRYGLRAAGRRHVSAPLAKLCAALVCLVVLVLVLV
eukprot:COSAG04_NODE_6451_length_1323_cov_1.563725_2_plen_159_part_01